MVAGERKKNLSPDFLHTDAQTNDRHNLFFTFQHVMLFTCDILGRGF